MYNIHTKIRIRPFFSIKKSSAVGIFSSDLFVLSPEEVFHTVNNFIAIFFNEKDVFRGKILKGFSPVRGRNGAEKLPGSW